MNLKTLSVIISRIFDFYFWLPVLLSATIFKSGLTANQIKILFPSLLVLDVGTPILVFFGLLKSKGVSDIDLTERRQRYKFFLPFTLVFTLSTILAYIFGNQLFFVLHLIGFSVVASMILITLFWKISGHLIMNTVSIFVLNFLLDWKILWLFILLPLVAFARIYLKKHTLVEVLSGAILGLLEPYLILKFFNLI